MAVLPDAERVESTRIPDAVRVTALWTQRALNATARYSLSEDSIAGQQTFDALLDFAALLGVGGMSPGRASDDQHVVMSTLLEEALIAGGSLPPLAPPAAPVPWFLWGIGALVVLGTGYVVYKSAYGRLDGFEEDYAEFNLHLRSARDSAANRNCPDAYSHWEQARLSHESLGDKRSEAGRKLVAAAALIRKAC
jgi:hypothetical protein